MSDPNKNEIGEGEIGEGDRESARRYNEDTRKFVENELNDVESREGSREGDRDREAGKDLTDAEEKARARARETDPQVSRDYREPADDD